MKLPEMLTYTDEAGKTHVNKVVLYVCAGVILIGLISLFIR